MVMLNAFVKYDYSLDLWEPRILNDANGTKTFEYDRTVKCSVVSGVQRTYVFTKEALTYSALVRNVINPKGEHLFTSDGEEYDMYVNSSEPIVDVYGNLTGYRQMLRRNQPVIQGGQALD